MSDINVTDSGIEEIIENLETEKTNIDNYIDTLNSELTKINSAWSSSGSIMYTSKMKDDYSLVLASLSESLNTYIQYLSGVFNEYSSFDESREEIEV